jgi:hypothetical protein
LKLFALEGRQSPRRTASIISIRRTPRSSRRTMAHCSFLIAPIPLAVRPSPTSCGTCSASGVPASHGSRQRPTSPDRVLWILSALPFPLSRDFRQQPTHLDAPGPPLVVVMESHAMTWREGVACVLLRRERATQEKQRANAA